MTGVDGIIGIVLRGILLTALIVLAACREEEDDTLPAASSAPAPVKADAAWLEVTESEAPAEFVARITGADPDRVAPYLDRASEVYRENSRMIANRVVQLWQEIEAKQAEPVPAIDLLQGLAPPERSSEVDSLGSVIQHYRVLRSQGRDHATALATATGEPR